MLYLSEVLNSRVYDAADNIIWVLDDILVSSKDDIYPHIEYLVIRVKSNEIIYLDYESIWTFGHHEIVLKHVFNGKKVIKPEWDYLHLSKDILDQQVIDLEWIKVVRVNDIKFTISNNKMLVIGLDVSWKWILRRLGVGWVDIYWWWKVDLIDWKNMQHFSWVLKLNTISAKLKKLHPADFADIIEDINIKYAAPLFRNISHWNEQYSAQIIEEINPNLLKLIIDSLDWEKVAKIMDKMSADEIVDLVHSLPKKDEKKILEKVEKNKLTKILKLILYPDNTAWWLMNNDYISVDSDLLVADVVEIIRKQSANFRHIYHVYVTNKNGKFVWPVSVRTLLISDKNSKLWDIAKPIENLVSLKPDNNLEEIIEIMTKYDLFVISVLDDDYKLLGVVTLDDVIRCAFPKD